MIEKVRIDRRWLPLNALRAFEGVARYGSFTGAASALNIAQSALSRHVISLENLIGVKLFERRPHSLMLTAAGEHLLPVVSRSFDRLEHAIDEIRDARTPQAAHAARADAAELCRAHDGAAAAGLPLRITRKSRSTWSVLTGSARRPQMSTSRCCTRDPPSQSA